MSSISEIFARALSSASKAYNLPTIEASTQELFGSALLDLTALTDHISELSLFSPNETLEDISTTHLVYLLAPYATAEVRARISLKALDDPGARVPFVEQTQISFVVAIPEGVRRQSGSVRDREQRGEGAVREGHGQGACGTAEGDQDTAV